MVIFKIHAAGNKSCVQVVLLHVPCLKTIALEPCLQELNEIQRFKARVMNEAPPHPHHRRASWRYLLLRSCSSARWREGAWAWKGGKYWLNRGEKQEGSRVNTHETATPASQSQVCGRFLSILLTSHHPHPSLSRSICFCLCASYFLNQSSLYLRYLCPSHLAIYV